MMKVFLSLTISLMTIHSLAQVENKQPDNSNVQIRNSALFRLFPTQNMWTFIKLNTRNGQMFQVQFNMKSESRFVTNLSLESLVSKEKEVNDRFILYSTQNIYT